jgi:hypothetical protein
MFKVANDVTYKRYRKAMHTLREYTHVRSCVPTNACCLPTLLLLPLLPLLPLLRRKVVCGLREP